MMQHTANAAVTTAASIACVGSVRARVCLVYVPLLVCSTLQEMFTQACDQWGYDANEVMAHVAGDAVSFSMHSPMG